MEIAIGHGDMIVADIKNKDGRLGIVIYPSDKPRNVGEVDPSWKDDEERPIRPSDVAIWIDSFESAKILRDKLEHLTIVWTLKPA